MDLRRISADRASYLTARYGKFVKGVLQCAVCLTRETIFQRNDVHRASGTDRISYSDEFLRLPIC
jgi:hypothetical protein